MPGFLHLYVGQEAVAAGRDGAPERRRPDHLDPPRPRPPRRQGRRLQADVRRAVRQGRPATARARAAACTSTTSTSACSAPTASSAAGSPIAVGAAFADKYRGTRQRRRLPSSATAPATSAPSTRRPTWPRCYSLPVVFVCENNGYGEFTRQERHQAIKRRRRPGRRLRHARRDRRRHGRGRGLRGRRRGGRPGPPRRRPDAARVPRPTASTTTRRAGLGVDLPRPTTRSPCGRSATRSPASRRG